MQLLLQKLARVQPRRSGSHSAHRRTFPFVDVYRDERSKALTNSAFRSRIIPAAVYLSAMLANLSMGRSVQDGEEERVSVGRYFVMGSAALRGGRDETAGLRLAVKCQCH